VGEFEERNSAASGGAGPRQSGIEDEQRFERLGGDTEA